MPPPATRSADINICASGTADSGIFCVILIDTAGFPDGLISGNTQITPAAGFLLFSPSIRDTKDPCTQTEHSHEHSRNADSEEWKKYSSSYTCTFLSTAQFISGTAGKYAYE